ncbi:SHOCT domain-containing protein [Mycobacterium sp. OTB74]|jgi:putative membrane protein|uniref:SHOCT domain-containing protein n=1 Tax=Mycobacterium sp. OTB74 TaxID=1853452 RepID=UPI00247704C7|nr:SHOCT domain-containing protein [Mycobacterium sp. OTB74]MDH6244050.1 putative membrane protein [Mycobacterium sp. OTB74]
MMWYGGGWGGWIMMTVTMVLFWGGLIVAAVWGIRALSGSGSGRDQVSAPAAPRAEDVLAQRFARGEIDEEEFQRRMALLHQPH